ncbi:hypothetical protein ACFS5M_12595 [Lacinutrix iliipiscaria]|uniref:HEPN AbiU2-like domain-containing protein n=1 Tax=Lacinutrix iliipiscaria TaxID=1230532 RepID=A0ABW5WT55_9FLAO
MRAETQNLKERLSEIRDTLLELEFIKKDIKSLRESYNSQEKEILTESMFFNRLYRNYIRLFIIDVFKLIGKKEDHNIQKLLEFCKINLKRIDWENSISLQELNDLSDNLSTISTKFEQIEGLRNKYYAHNDKRKKTFKYDISLKELWEILEGLQNIFSELNLKFDNHHWYFDIQYTTPGVINNLYKFKKIRKLTLNGYGKLDSSIEIQELLKIMRG